MMHGGGRPPQRHTEEVSMFAMKYIWYKNLPSQISLLFIYLKFVMTINIEFTM